MARFTMASSVSELEQRLRIQFRLREEIFTHLRTTWKLLLPADPEELIDEAAFEADERLPYWADLWPSARGLARFLLDNPPDSAIRAVELGCGVALPALALRAAGIDVVATDYEPDAIAFASVNAHRNDLGPLTTQMLDWRTPPRSLEPVELIVGADVLYEPHHADAIASLLEQMLRPHGRAIFAGPGRRHESALRVLADRRGWQWSVIDTRRETQPGGAVSTISILDIRRLSM